MTSKSDDLGAWLAGVRATTDATLAAWSQEAAQRWPGDVGAAIGYALAGEGKRLRPALVHAAFAAAGGQGHPTDFAAVVETVHTYSLVHDDLPCMDDDDLRRGRATVHRAYSVEVAVEAGFRMVALASWGLERGADALTLPRETRTALRAVLFQGAGVAGMIGGQVLDLEAEDRVLTRDELVAVHRAKTGALLTASVVMGGLAAKADARVLAALQAYGGPVGLAFQIVDDILDATATSEALGKTAGKDALQGKSTYAELLGVEGARQEADRLVGDAVRVIATVRGSERLVQIAHHIIGRAS
ncbi:MAG: polyprenyl synthetase family protein [Gemmatimonadales bacterium]